MKTDRWNYKCPPTAFKLYILLSFILIWTRPFPFSPFFFWSLSTSIPSGHPVVQPSPSLCLPLHLCHAVSLATSLTLCLFQSLSPFLSSSIPRHGWPGFHPYLHTIPNHSWSLSYSLRSSVVQNCPRSYTLKLCLTRTGAPELHLLCQSSLSQTTFRQRRSGHTEINQPKLKNLSWKI